MYSDFLNTLADRRHRPEVIRLITALHFVELVARILPGIFGKIPQTLQGITEESNNFHCRNILIRIYPGNGNK